MRRTCLRPASRPRGIVGPLLLVLVATAGPASTVPVSAAPPYLEFLRGLRDRRYEDMALYYLDRLEADLNVPAEVKEVLDYERAATLIGMARGGSDPSTQAKRLDEATAALEKFIAEHPNHPLVAKAQTERGEILLGKARVAILEAESPGNEGKAEQLRAEARQFIAKAREIFENARQRYEEQWKGFGPFVDADDEETRSARNAALNALIQSRLHLAECTYREARTYPAGSPKRNELLTAAAKQYEAIHADYRSQVGGLFARLWMAKCYEEQTPRPEEGKELADQAAKDARQKLNIAEAIYSELLEHDARGSQAAAQMQEYAFWFKMIVRNHPVLADHQLVVDQATEWLKTRTGPAAQTTPALGIRWERAQAFEKLANRRDATESDRTRLLRSALADAEFVNAYPGEYRDVSRAMIQRTKAALGRGEGDPRDFDAANGLAQTLHNQIGEKQEAVKEAKTAEEKAAAEQALAAHLDETARVLRLALGFAGPGTDRSAVNGARYRLAYVEYNRGRPYDAAVLGEYVARKFKDESPQLALDSAYLAMAAYYKLYDAVPSGRPTDFELGKLRETADFIASAFPDSEQASEARMMLGRLFLQERDFAQAAEWFSKVPESSPQAMDARLLAGRSFWDAYAIALAQPEEQRPDQATLDKLKADAERFLREGLAMADRQIPNDAVPPENVVAAKVTLAQIANLDGKYQEAIDLLTGGPQPVVKLVAVADETKRPKQGVTSEAFAALTHQQLLRAYIGTQQIDPALEQMRMLERIGGEGNTTVFVQLGRQIKTELESLPAGQERDAVMAAFDQFLGKLSQMQQGQTYGSLVWIGETYFGLAQAAADPKRSNYFNRAAASYETILSRANQQGFLPTVDAVNGVRLRLAAVEQSRGDFAKAYGLAKQVLKAAPKALNAQVTAAEILRDWGMSGQADAPQKLLLAIQGDPSDPAAPVWGWGQIAQRLQRALWAGQTNEEYKEILRQARYEIPAARRAYANTLPTEKEQQIELGKAEKELLAYVAVTPKDEIGEVWWAKLDELYADIQRDQNPNLVSVKHIQPATEYVSEPATPVEETPLATPVATAPTPTETAVAAPTSSGSGLLPVLFGVLLAGGVTAGIVFLMLKGGRKKPRLVYGGAPVGRPAPPLDLSAFPAVETGGTTPAPAVKQASAPRPTQRPKPPAAPKTEATPKPAATAAPKPARPASPEQPLVAKNVRRTKKPGE